MGYLDDTGLAHFWARLKETIALKQNLLTGTEGQFVGFDAGGNPVAVEAPGGQSPYDYASEAGYTGTEEQFRSALANLRALPFVRVYGAEWSGTTSPAWSRTGDAEGLPDPVPSLEGGEGSSPFDEIYPWKGIRRVTDSVAGELVEIPKFWYRLTADGNKLRVEIANQPVEGFVISPAHMDRGDGKGERNVVYIGRYHCGSDYTSQSGVTPQNNLTRTDARDSIHALGSTVWQCDFAMRFTIWLLYLVEFANWNSQSCIGRGCGTKSLGVMGYTDSMAYHTGTMQASRSSYGFGTQYRYIEGLWDNVYDWLDGSYNNEEGLHLILKPADFSDTDGGTLVGLPNGRFPMAFAVSDGAGFPMFYPIDAGGSATKGMTDIWYFYAANNCLLAGGEYYTSTESGLFCISCNSPTTARANIGCRLQKLP